MYKLQTYDEILGRMLDKIPNTYDKREGSVIWLALAPAAAELAQSYIEFDRIVNETFADTASYEYLRRRAEERGLYPFEPTNAILKAEFNQDVQLGTRFGKEDLTYTLISKIEDEEFSYEIMCEQKGTKGNQYFGTIIPLEYVNGLTKAEITELLIPARDLEKIEDFRIRYYDSFDSQAYGGNIQDYIEKTSSIEGVGSVQVIPVWNGGGTVKVIILDGEFNKPSDKLIENVQNELDPVGHSGLGVGLAPIGHIVTVVGVEEVTINVKSDIMLDVGQDWNKVKTLVEESIETYLKELREDWSNLTNNGIIVRIAQIENRILNVPGVIDVSNTTINDSNKNLQLELEEIPVLGGVENGN